MTLTTLSSDVSIIWFWAGICLLLSMAHVYRKSLYAIRRVDWFRADLDRAFVTRWETIRRSFPRDVELRQICDSAESARTSSDACAHEMHLDVVIYWRHSIGSPIDDNQNASIEPIIEKIVSELRPYRDRYNEAAIYVKILRRSFPGGIITRALIGEDPPLFPEPDFT